MQSVPGDQQRHSKRGGLQTDKHSESECIKTQGFLCLGVPHFRHQTWAVVFLIAQWINYFEGHDVWDCTVGFLGSSQGGEWSGCDYGVHRCEGATFPGSRMTPECSDRQVSLTTAVLSSQGFIYEFYLWNFIWEIALVKYPYPLQYLFMS